MLNLVQPQLYNGQLLHCYVQFYIAFANNCLFTHAIYLGSKLDYKEFINKITHMY